MPRIRAILPVVAVFLSAVVALAQGGPAPGMKRMDTGYGFSIDVPATVERGPQAGNARLVLGDAADDFTIVVANFGPKQDSLAAAGAVYRESFGKSGMRVDTESDVVVGSVPGRRFVMSFDATAGRKGHAEAVLFPVADEVFAVIVVVPESTIEARRALIGRVLDSIRFGK